MATLILPVHVHLPRPGCEHRTFGLSIFILITLTTTQCFRFKILARVFKKTRAQSSTWFFALPCVIVQIFFAPTEFVHHCHLSNYILLICTKILRTSRVIFLVFPFPTSISNRMAMVWIMAWIKRIFLTEYSFFYPYRDSNTVPTVWQTVDLKGVRTQDLLIKWQSLSQLSYTCIHSPRGWIQDKEKEAVYILVINYPRGPLQSHALKIGVKIGQTELPIVFLLLKKRKHVPFICLFVLKWHEVCRHYYSSRFFTDFGCETPRYVQRMTLLKVGLGICGWVFSIYLKTVDLPAPLRCQHFGIGNHHTINWDVREKR